MMDSVQELTPTIGVGPACTALGVPRSTIYRRQRPVRQPRSTVRAPHPRALSPAEQTSVRNVLNSERFVDQAPRTVYATLLDEGVYLCHWRTMYRLLRADAATRERRAIRRHPVYTRPELLATGPCQVWSWDITKLRGPQPGVWYSVYVVINIFSRMVVGWLQATHEEALLAEQVLADACQREGITPSQLTIHADRGAPMTSKAVAELLVDLGVRRSHSRPTVSNDNPYSEAQFKTMKYGPTYPDRFASLADARAWVTMFVQWSQPRAPPQRAGPADTSHGLWQRRRCGRCRPPGGAQRRSGDASGTVCAGAADATSRAHRCVDQSAAHPACAG